MVESLGEGADEIFAAFEQGGWLFDAASGGEGGEEGLAADAFGPGLEDRDEFGAFG